MNDERRFGLELLKLLLQVACADGRVHRVEADIVLGLSRYWDLPEGAVAALRTSLERQAGFPPPDLALLRQRPRRVLEAVRLLCQADGAVASGERELVRELEALLGARLSG